MAKKVLENVEMGMTWTSYIASAEGVLRSAGLWEGETYQLMGMTGIGFHFIIHKDVCPSSVTVYDWVNEHLAAMDRIGVHTEVYSVMDVRMNTFPAMQQDALKRIKKSIDQGKAVVAWAPTSLLEFGIIHGYDDEDGVLFVKECTGKPSDPLLYENLGKSEVPMLFYQLFKGRVETDREKEFRASLKYGVDEWEKTFYINPFYASGRRAYDNLLRSMEEGTFNEFGLAYNLAVYADAKNCVARYLSWVGETSTELKGLDEAIRCYGQIAEKYNRLTRLFPFAGVNGTGCKTDRMGLTEGIVLIKECRGLEEEAIRTIKTALEL